MATAVPKGALLHNLSIVPQTEVGLSISIPQVHTSSTLGGNCVNKSSSIFTSVGACLVPIPNGSGGNCYMNLTATSQLGNTPKAIILLQEFLFFIVHTCVLCLLIFSLVSSLSTLFFWCVISYLSLLLHHPSILLLANQSNCTCPVFLAFIKRVHFKSAPLKYI